MPQKIKPKLSKVYQQIVEAVLDNRIILLQGGQGSTKTYSALQFISILAKNSTVPLLISIVSETFPHLWKGAIRDWQDILTEWGWWDRRKWNETRHEYKLGLSKIEFFSVDNPDKMKGPRRDILYINELDNVNYRAWELIEPRTKLLVLADFNPVREFYAHTEIVPRPDTILLKSTYLDNPYLSEGERNAIEARRGNERWWKVFGLGEIGEVDGLILTDWEQINDSEFPVDGAFYGIDFGFTNNPTAIIKVVREPGVLYVHEILYKTGLISRRLIDKVKVCDLSGLTVADCAQPLTIADLNDAGIKVLPSMTYKGAVNKRIEMLEDYHIKVTKSSVNVIKELRNWQWIYNKKENRYINEPVDNFNHALKALGYAVEVKTKHRRGIRVHN